MVGWLSDFFFFFCGSAWLRYLRSLPHAFYLIFSVPIVGDIRFRHIVEDVQYVMPLQIPLEIPT